VKSRNFSVVFAIAERSQIRSRPHLRAVQLSLSAISQQDTASSTKAKGLGSNRSETTTITGNLTINTELSKAIYA